MTKTNLSIMLQGSILWGVPLFIRYKLKFYQYLKRNVYETSHIEYTKFLLQRCFYFCPIVAVIIFLTYLNRTRVADNYNKVVLKYLNDTVL